jgi:hypothetical protein
MLCRLLVATLLALLPGAAFAEEGAVSVEGGAGGTALANPAPYAQGSPTLVGAAPSFRLGGRYAVRNWLEVGATGFFDLPTTYYHPNLSIVTANGTFSGATIQEQLHREGGALELRVQRGLIFRVVAGLDVGWSHRAYTGITALGPNDHGDIIDFKLGLVDTTVDNVLVAPIVGLEWAAGDHWSVAVLPRAELLLG